MLYNKDTNSHSYLARGECDVEPTQMNDLLRDLVTELNNVYRWLAERAGINQSDLMCLFLVRTGGGQATPKAIANQLGLSTGATAIMLNRLEAAGFIERRRHPTDRRGVLIALGPKVESSGIMALRDYVEEVNRDLLARYSDEELALVRRFFSDIIRNTHVAMVAARANAQSKETGKPDEAAPES